MPRLGGGVAVASVLVCWCCALCRMSSDVLVCLGCSIGLLLTGVLICLICYIGVVLAYACVLSCLVLCLFVLAFRGVSFLGLSCCGLSWLGFVYYYDPTWGEDGGPAIGQLAGVGSCLDDRDWALVKSLPSFLGQMTGNRPVGVSDERNRSCGVPHGVRTGAVTGPCLSSVSGGVRLAVRRSSQISGPRRPVEAACQ